MSSLNQDGVFTIVVINEPLITFFFGATLVDNFFDTRVVFKNVEKNFLLIS